MLCPQYNYAWNAKEVSYHDGGNDYYASVRGKVYDLTKFYKIQCADSIKCKANRPDRQIGRAHV